jgi:hypothetical protein
VLLLIGGIMATTLFLLKTLAFVYIVYFVVGRLGSAFLLPKDD